MIGAAIDKGGNFKSPAEVTIDGKPYISIEAAAAKAGLSYVGLMKRIYDGKVQGVIDYKHDARRQPTRYLPADLKIEGPSKVRGRNAAKQKRLEAEARRAAKAEKAAFVNTQEKPKAVNSSFPALSVDSDGVPFPAKVNTDLPSVKCSECPHCADKTRKCYALALHMNEKGEPKYHSCHRIGRIVIPMQGWEKFTAKGESLQRGLQGHLQACQRNGNLHAHRQGTEP